MTRLTATRHCRYPECLKEIEKLFSPVFNSTYLLHFSFRQKFLNKFKGNFYVINGNKYYKIKKTILDWTLKFEPTNVAPGYKFKYL